MTNQETEMFHVKHPNGPSTDKDRDAAMSVADLLWVIRYEISSGRITMDSPVALYDRHDGGNLQWLMGFDDHLVQHETTTHVPNLDVVPRSTDRSKAQIALCLRPGEPQ